MPPYYTRRYVISIDERGEPEWIEFDPYDDIDEHTEDEYEEDEPEEDYMERELYKQEDIDFINEVKEGL